MPRNIPVSGPGWTLFINPQAFKHYLPNFSTQVLWNGTYDAYNLEQELQNIFPHVHLPHRALRDALRSFFTILAHSNTAFTFLDDTIGERLLNLLDHDLYSGFRHASGLSHVRRRFVVLACLANYAHSSKLANALGDFIYHSAHDLLNYERSTWLPDWEYALSLILPLMDSRLRRKCEDILSQRYMPRPRRAHRRIAAPTYGPLTIGPPVVRSQAPGYVMAPGYVGSELQSLAWGQQVMMQNQGVMFEQLSGIENALVGRFY